MGEPFCTGPLATPCTAAAPPALRRWGRRSSPVRRRSARVDDHVIEIRIRRLIEQSAARDDAKLRAFGVAVDLLKREPGLGNLFGARHRELSARAVLIADDDPVPDGDLFQTG